MSACGVQVGVAVAVAVSVGVERITGFSFVSTVVSPADDLKNETETSPNKKTTPAIRTPTYLHACRNSGI